MSIAEALITDFSGEAELTRKVLEAVPGDRLGWKPHEKSMSLGQLAGHIAEAPGWASAMLTDEFDFAEVAESYVPFLPASTAELLETFDRSRGTIIHHIVHHRGQLTVYLRLLDVAVPSTYGPTADCPTG